MTANLDRDIVTIKYNLLNLPDTIQFSNGNQIVHTYDAGGRKFRTEYFTLYTPIQIPLSGIYNWNNRWDVLDTWEVKAYVGNFEYHQFKDSEDDYYSLIRINNTEGYVTSLTSPSYFYYRKDHIGNNREVWKAVANTTIQRTQYYPSGLPIEFNNGDNPGWQPYKYGGKEFVEMHGLDEYDSEARWYYPAIMRTTTPDPLAEMYYDISPYAWCANNPVRFVDPDGRIIVDSNGVRIYKNGEWTGNNSYGARRIGEAMMNTPVGKELFNQLANSAIPVELILDQGVGDGSRNARTDNKYDEKSGTHTSSTITVFEGMAEKKLTELQGKKNDIDLGGTFSSGSETDKVRLENSMPTSVEEIIGQKAIHEAVHVLDKGSQRKHQPDKNKREELPIKKEIEAVKQTPLYRIKQQ